MYVWICQNKYCLNQVHDITSRVMITRALYTDSLQLCTSCTGAFFLSYLLSFFLSFFLFVCYVNFVLLNKFPNNHSNTTKHYFTTCTLQSLCMCEEFIKSDIYFL